MFWVLSDARGKKTGRKQALEPLYVAISLTGRILLQSRSCDNRDVTKQQRHAHMLRYSIKLIGLSEMQHTITRAHHL